MPRILAFLENVECRVDDEIEKRWRATGGQGEVKITARLKTGVESLRPSHIPKGRARIR